MERTSSNTLAAPEAKGCLSPPIQSQAKEQL